MAVTTYTELKAALADWMVGQSVTTQLDTFIDLAEAEMNRRLRVRDMLARATISTTSAYNALPVDFLQARNITLTSSGIDYTLRVITPDHADYQRMYLKGGLPQFVCFVGNEMEIIPAPSSDSASVEMLYWAKLTPLSDDAPSNFILDRWPDLYLNLALAAAQPYLANPQAAAFHRAEAERIFDEIRFENGTAEYGASPLIARTRRVF